MLNYYQLCICRRPLFQKLKHIIMNKHNISHLLKRLFQIAACQILVGILAWYPFHYCTYRLFQNEWKWQCTSFCANLVAYSTQYKRMIASLINKTDKYITPCVVRLLVHLKRWIYIRTKRVWPRKYFVLVFFSDGLVISLRCTLQLIYNIIYGFISFPSDTNQTSHSSYCILYHIQTLSEMIHPFALLLINPSFLSNTIYIYFLISKQW